MEAIPPDGPAPEPWAPIPGAPRGSSRWLFKLLVIFAVVFGGCGTFLVANTRARETIIAVSKGATHPYYIPSEAMAPTMPPGSRIMVTSHFGAIRRFDVIVLKAPPSDDAANLVIVKRVIGLPGETIDVDAGGVRINGQALDERYLGPGKRVNCFGGETTCNHLTIPADSFYVMGDNRTNSKDSRFFGPIPRSSIIGVVIRITAPPSRAGSVPGSSR